MDCFESAGVTQLVECDLAKVDVAGSNPVSRSSFPRRCESLPLSAHLDRLALIRRVEKSLKESVNS